MSNSHDVTYRIGIDVGSYSLGMACVVVDQDGTPIELRHPLVVRHDGNVAPWAQKAAQTRLATRGFARRARVQKRNRRKRLAVVAATLESLGYQPSSLHETSDPHDAWLVRARLAGEHITDPTERAHLIHVAVSHMAAHRGRRSPFVNVRTLLPPAAPSPQYLALYAAACAHMGVELPDELTPGQIAAAVLLHERGIHSGAHRTPLRSKNRRKDRKQRVEGLMPTALMQSDYATELRRIVEVQGIPEAHFETLVKAVFHMESPRAAAAARAGRDPLPGQQNLPRAHRAHGAFQLYRIVSTVANLRIGRTGRDAQPLTREQIQSATAYLQQSHSTSPTWGDLAEHLGIEHHHLRGTATPTADGDLSARRPPLMSTDALVNGHRKEAPTLVRWWDSADAATRDALISVLLDGTNPDEDDPAGEAIEQLLRDLPDDEQEVLMSLDLASGRAAYSLNTLTRLTQRMLTEGCDLHAARMCEFGVGRDWRPPTPAINERVGHPTVDLILKHVARYLAAAEASLGTPEAVVIEHVRDAFASTEKSREYEEQTEERRKDNETTLERLRNEHGLARPTMSDARRLSTVQRQNGACCYCGATITLANSEMDHIVPRSGPGSTNTRVNLVAVCHPCNQSKGATAFATWAASEPRPGVSLTGATERVRDWAADPGMSPRDAAAHRRSVISRLRRTEADDPLDDRSLESVAWMARELAARTRHHYAAGSTAAGTDVRVFRGEITAAARAASGIDGRIHLLRPTGIDGSKKSRFDRRHHAVDAAVIALMRPSVAATLALRNNQRAAQRIAGISPDWREFTGATTGDRVIWKQWTEQMGALTGLVNDALDGNRIPVTQPLRLRFGGQAHDGKLKPLDQRLLGEQFDCATVDRAATPALWCALTSHPDYEAKRGLPANPDRVIRVHSTRLVASDPVDLFPSAAASVTIRGGCADIGNSIHHARVFAYPAGKKIKFAILRVFATDLQRNQAGDLFAAELPPQSISRRTAATSLRRALDAGSATCLGWLVTGDELLLDAAVVGGQGADLAAEYPQITHWRVDGFADNARLRLRPVLLAGEGVDSPDQLSAAARMILCGQGWRVSAEKVLSTRPCVIRRDALGTVRLDSRAHLPVTWEVK